MSSTVTHPDACINYLLEDTGVGTWECDHVPGLLTLNGAVISGVDLAPALIESRLEDWAANVHPEDPNRIKPAYRRRFAGGNRRTAGADFRNIRPPGA